jgi:hypothetical protein
MGDNNQEIQQPGSPVMVWEFRLLVVELLVADRWIPAYGGC